MDSRIKTRHNQHRGRRGERAGVTGSLTSATIGANFELSELLSRGVQSVSSFQWRHARCIVGKRRVFPDPKITTSPTGKKLLLWVLTTCACGRRARLMDICYSCRDLWTQWTVVTRCPISFEFTVPISVFIRKSGSGAICLWLCFFIIHMDEDRLFLGLQDD